MPPKKKQANNKKKKGKNKAPTADASGAATKTTTIQGDIPTFHGDVKEQSRSTTDGIYQTYKRATAAFRDGLHRLLPESSRLETVQDLNRAANFILDAWKAGLEADDVANGENVTLHLPDTTLLVNLDTAIELRSKLAATYTDGDPGHQYMIDTLKYCRTALRLSRALARQLKERWSNKREVINTSDDNIAKIGGRFHALLDLADDEEVEDAQEFDERVQTGDYSPKVPRGPEKEYSVDDDLIKCDDRFQASALLWTMNDLMGAVDAHFMLLKEVLRGRSSHHTTTHLHHLVECTVVTNLAMESVQRMFAELTLDHPHVRSFYDVLAVVFWHGVPEEIDNLIPSSIWVEKPHLSKQFVGDIVEASFHNKGRDGIEGIVRKFASVTGANLQKVQKQAGMISTGVDMEIQLSKMEQQNRLMNQMAAARGLHPHKWLLSNAFIGGDRCILNTQHLLQKIFDVTNLETKLVPVEGWFGSTWDEQGNQARCIRGDMDQYVAGEVLPELISICTHFPFKRIPNTSELMPLLDALYQYIHNDLGRPVPIALTFGIHALLTSVVALQGNGDVTRLAVSAKASFNKLFLQLDEAAASKYPTHFTYRMNLDLFRQLRVIASPVMRAGTRTSELNAFWNPVVGGSLLEFGIYLCSINLGASTVDSFGQLRFVLHLYNAMKQRKIVGEVRLLERLDRTFAKTKAIWVAGRPERGSFVKHFFLAWGMSQAKASMLGEEARRNVGFPTKLPETCRSSSRDLVPILPQNFSASYPLVVMRDFSNAADADYSIANATDEGKKKLKENNAFAGCLVRINQMRDAMDEDEDDVIPVNFPLVGDILNGFCEELSKELGWSTLINHLVVTCPDEVRMSTTVGGDRRKEGFHRTDGNLGRQALAHFWAVTLGEMDNLPDERLNLSSKAAGFMERYFQIDNDCYTFLLY
jgi:hypothetical protein